MEIQIKYSGLEDRQVKVAKNEALGYRMLHDTFDDPNWKREDPIVGTLTFTDAIEPTVITPPARDLAAEVDQLKSDVTALSIKVGRAT